MSKKLLTIIVSIALIVITLMGSSCFASDQKKTISNESVKLSSLEKEYKDLFAKDSKNKSEWNALESELIKLISDGSYSSAKSSYLVGLMRYKQGDYEGAKEYFNRTINLNSFSYLAELAFSNVAVCDEQLGNDLLAMNDYKRLLNFCGRDSAVAPKALFNIGRLYYKDNNINDAATVFNLLKETYPNSEYSKLAPSFVEANVSPSLFAELSKYLRTEDTIITETTNNEAWGYYDGNPILLEQNTVFYNTVVNDSNLRNAYLSGDYDSLYLIYHGAYQKQVLFMALSTDADKAKIVAPKQLVDELIMTSGVYDGEDGQYSDEVFNSASETEKKRINDYYSLYYPYSVVVSDLQTAIVSDHEKTFVSDLASHVRSYVDDSYFSTQQVYDRFCNVLSSNKHIDEFYNTFVSTLFGSVK